MILFLTPLLGRLLLEGNRVGVLLREIDGARGDSPLPIDASARPQTDAESQHALVHVGQPQVEALAVVVFAADSASPPTRSSAGGSAGPLSLLPIRAEARLQVADLPAIS